MSPLTLDQPEPINKPGRRVIRRSKTRIVVQAAILWVPWRVRRRLLERLFGWELDPDSTIGPSILDVDFVRMASRTRIGPLNLIRSLRELDMGHNATIGRYNWIRFAFPGTDEAEYPGYLRMGREARITGFHFIDVSGGLDMHELAAFGGARSTVFGHAPSMDEYRQKAQRVILEERAIVTSACVVNPGTHIAAGAVCSMGSVLRGHIDRRNTLYAGNPAKPIMEMDNAFMRRTTYEWD